uniref:Peptidase C14 caspase domain-containing protein n=1 Tax=Ditylum brightwellii TaxID=49249 RepID=A0A7S4QNJ4_9STRA|mmetsp:Transcript_7265/g.9870  ORF Transcript_7265/g.9870 Transcript_7265/m.9870 type:complete len:313 (+) Transcript_7265:143-1081(+)
MGWLVKKIREFKEEQKAHLIKAEVRMISGCDDSQTSADVSNVKMFELPDPAGKAGGACTSAYLSVLYKDKKASGAELTFVEVLQKMRVHLTEKKYTQIPQLSSSKPIDLNEPFQLVPDTATGTKRALLIGINYTGMQPGELTGCHNDVKNVKEYLMNEHSFKEENITVMLDDNVHESPTKANIISGYKKLTKESQPGDAVFCHFSGHGSQIKDDDWFEEEDGLDETLVPVDFKENGQIRDDDIFDILVVPMKEGVTLTCFFDCCHSGTVMDLPFTYRADSDSSQMVLDKKLDFGKVFREVGDFFNKKETNAK